MKNQKGFIQIPILIVIIAGVLILRDFGVRQHQIEKIEEEKQTDYSNYLNSSSYNSPYNYDYKESYPVGFSGTETMEACNSDTGNCYDLDIDSDGENIERINFPNGGWRDVNYSDCDDGYCYVEDEDGTEWELQY